MDGCFASSSFLRFRSFSNPTAVLPTFSGRRSDGEAILSRFRTPVRSPGSVGLNRDDDDDEEDDDDDEDDEGEDEDWVEGEDWEHGEDWEEGDV